MIIVECSCENGIWYPLQVVLRSASVPNALLVQHPPGISKIHSDSSHASAYNFVTSVLCPGAIADFSSSASGDGEFFRRPEENSEQWWVFLESVRGVPEANAGSADGAKTSSMMARNNKEKVVKFKAGDLIDAKLLDTSGIACWVEGVIVNVWELCFAHVTFPQVGSRYDRVMEVKDIRHRTGAVAVPNIPMSGSKARGRGSSTSAAAPAASTRVPSVFSSKYTERKRASKQEKEDGEDKSHSATAMYSDYGSNSEKVEKSRKNVARADIIESELDFDNAEEHHEEVDAILSEWSGLESYELTEKGVLLRGKPEIIRAVKGFINRMFREDQKIRDLIETQRKLLSIMDREMKKVVLQFEFDPSVGGQTIGAGGSNLKRARQIADVISVACEENKITVTATSEAAARLAIEEVDVAEETHSLLPSLIPVLIGNHGKIIREIRESSGVSRFVIQEDNTVLALGTRAAIKRAMRAVAALARIEQNRREIEEEMGHVYEDMSQIGYPMARRQSPPPRQSLNSTSSSSQCYNCGQYGHFSRECPQPKNPSRQAMLGPRARNNYGRDDNTDEDNADYTREPSNREEITDDPVLSNRRGNFNRRRFEDEEDDDDSEGNESEYTGDSDSDDGDLRNKKGMYSHSQPQQQPGSASSSHRYLVSNPRASNNEEPPRRGRGGRGGAGAHRGDRRGRGGAGSSSGERGRRDDLSSRQLVDDGDNKLYQNPTTLGDFFRKK